MWIVFSSMGTYSVQFILVCALFFCSCSAILAGVNGFVGLGIVVVLMALICLIFFTIHPSVTERRAFFAALLALGIGAVYSAFYFWVFGYDFLLVSDSAVYDALAHDIAQTTPWYKQINPLSYEYVRELGNYYGKIKYPGFYKILGIGYTIGLQLGMESVSFQIPLIINIISFSFVGLALYKILASICPSRWVEWGLWSLFMTTPFFLEQLVWIRKDIFLLMSSLFAIQFIQKRNHPLWVALLIFLVATVRFPQAVWLMVLFLVNEAMFRRRRTANVIVRHSVIIALCTLVLLVASVAYLPDLNISPESLAALLEDQEKASIGFSRHLTTNIVGAALYGILYPFPSLFPQDTRAVFDTFYAYLHLSLFFAVLLMIRNKKGGASPFLVALWITLLLTLAGYALGAMMSWKSIGFVVFESRFKLFGMALVVILFGHLSRRWQSYQYRLTESGGGTAP